MIWTTWLLSRSPRAMPNKPRRQSVLLPIIGMTGIIVAGVLLFNSLVIKELLDHHHRLQTQLSLLEASSALFNAVRHFGFERGRVSVVLNSHEMDQRASGNAAFARGHGSKGSLALVSALDLIEALTLSDDTELIHAIRTQVIEVGQMRTQYQQAFERPLEERDPELDDRWFALMSRQISDINRLLYAIKAARMFNPGWDHEFDALYLVSRLRDDAGPVVSYLAAAMTNPSSLTVARVREIRARRRAVQSNLAELATLSRIHLDVPIQVLVEQFKQAYLDQLFGLADSMLHAEVTQPRSPEELDTYLRAGLNAVEILNALSDSVYEAAHSKLHAEISRSIWRLRGGVALSAVTLLVPILSFTLVYLRLYRRIIRASGTINQLAADQTDVSVAAPYANDEMGDVESGLLAFRDRLQELRQTSRILLDLSIRDSLTGLVNHAEVLRLQAREHANALRHGYVYTVLMIDIDHFKAINDAYGHQVGDTVLAAVARALESELRAGDLVGRYGGEEFLVLLPQTGLGQGLIVAQKLRLRVQQGTGATPMPEVTISIGAAEGPGEGMPTQIIARADHCLYQAKRFGRNRVEYQPDSQPSPEIQAL